MPTIFSRIIAGEIPCYKVFEDEHTFAFLDIRPHTVGHTLIVPKMEVDHILDLPEPYYSALFRNAKTIGQALKKATGCKRVGGVLLGFDVPHVHYHIIPLFQSSDIDQKAARERAPQEMQEIHRKILAEMK